MSVAGWDREEGGVELAEAEDGAGDIVRTGRPTVSAVKGGVGSGMGAADAVCGGAIGLGGHSSRGDGVVGRRSDDLRGLAVLALGHVDCAGRRADGSSVDCDGRATATIMLANGKMSGIQSRIYIKKRKKQREVARVASRGYARSSPTTGRWWWLIVAGFSHGATRFGRERLCNCVVGSWWRGSLVEGEKEKKKDKQGTGAVLYPVGAVGAAGGER